MPAVSIKIKSSSLTENGILIESIVVPAISETINLSSFIKLFIKVDLPALGLPRIAIFLPSGTLVWFSEIEVFKNALKSVRFLLCSALISNKSLIPFL